MEPITSWRPEPVPVFVLAAMLPSLRDECCRTLVRDLPGARTVRYDFEDPSAGTGLRRIVSQCGRVLEESHVDIDAHCMACVLRIDIVITLERLRRRGAEPVAVAVPVGADLPAVVSALDSGVAPSDGPAAPAEVRAVTLAVDRACAVIDLMGDALLAERGCAWGPADRRSVGEVLANSIDYADTVVSLGAQSAGADALLAHLADDRVYRVGQLHELRVPELTTVRRDTAAAHKRIDPRHIQPTRFTDCDHAWTLDLHTWRPFHPQRLSRRLPDLALGRLRGRGRFWLPTRPDTVCRWDNAGAQLSVGDDGSWEKDPPSTRIVVTGIDEVDQDRIREAFLDALMTDRELVRGLEGWRERDDGFDTWLGTRQIIR